MSYTDKVFYTLLLLSFLPLTITKCTYNPEEEIFNKVDSSNFSSVLINFSETDDTVFLRGNERVTFNFESSSEVYSTMIFLNDSLIHEREGKVSWFQINTSAYTDGVYQLTIISNSKSNTGSLADILNAESIISTYTKPVIIDNKELEIPKYELQVIDGVLALIWEPYRGHNFMSYFVTIDDVTHSIKDKNETRFEIQSYAGGSLIYNFGIEAKSEKLSNRDSFRDDLSVSLTLVNDSSIQVSGDFFKYRSTDKYLVRRLANVSPSNSNIIPSDDVIISSKNMAEKPVVFKNYFPVVHDYSVAVINSDGKYNTLASSVRFKNSIRSNVDAHEHFVSKGDIIRVDQRGVLFDFTNLNNGRTYTAKQPIGHTPDGKVIYKYLNRSVLIIDPTSMEVKSSFNLPEDVFIRQDVQEIKANVSNDMFLALEAKATFRSNPFTKIVSVLGNTYVVDLINSEVTWTGNPANSKYGEIMNGGEFVTLFKANPSVGQNKRSFLEFRDNFFVDTTAMFENFNTSLSGYSLSEKLFFHAEGNTLSVYDISDHTLIKELEFSTNILKIISNKHDLFCLVLDDEESKRLIIYDAQNLAYKATMRLLPNAKYEQLMLSGQKLLFMSGGRFSDKEFYTYEIN